MNWNRNILLAVALVNLLAVPTIPVLFSLICGEGKLVILSTYREMDLNGVIDHTRLMRFRGGEFASEWNKIPDYFGEGFDVVTEFAWGISALCMMSSTAIFAVLWKTRATK